MRTAAGLHGYGCEMVWQSRAHDVFTCRRAGCAFAVQTTSYELFALENEPNERLLFIYYS